jgi:predicted nucleotidyltransferase
MAISPFPAAIRAEILRIVGRYGGSNVRLFGSLARGEGRLDSDVDLLIDLEPQRSLLDLVAIKQDLEDLLGRPVDVVTEDAVSPYLRDPILDDAVPL